MNEEVQNEILRSLGRIESSVASQSKWMESHVLEDKLMAESIKNIELARARQGGFITAFVAIGSVIGTLFGLAVQWFSHKS